MTTLPIQDDILDHSVTRYMRFDFCKVHAEQTVAEALADLRIQQPQGRIIYFYVMDCDDKLVGVVPTRRLLLSAPETKIDEIMVKNVTTVSSEATVREACELFLKHKYLAIPVMHGEKMVGLVDVELFAEGIDDLEQTRQQEDLFQLIGVHLSAAEQASPIRAFASRFPWLLCNIAGGLAAAFLAYLFEAELKQAVALAMFIPIVLALSESVSIQSVTLALVILSGQQPTWALLRNKLSRELATGLLLGVVCGCLIAIVEVVWLRDSNVALALLAGIGLGMTASAGTGLAMPFLLRMLRLDPQVAAGPIALAAADMITLTVYFSVARWLLP
jgi:magnesium transporter